MITKWDERFMRLAKEIATWSKDPSRQIGAIAVDESRRILSTGYNGFPSRLNDSTERLNDREQKYKYIVHAEMNCIYNACQNGISLNSAKLYVWGLPVCSECAKGVIQVGISEVYCGHTDDSYHDSIWKTSFETTKEMFAEAGVKVHEIKFETIPEPMVIHEPNVAVGGCC
jgi:dCMP deaminase